MKSSFKMYDSYYDAIKHLDHASLGRLFEAIFVYRGNGCIMETSDPLYFPFMMIKSRMDEDDELSKKLSEKRQKAGLQGGRPKKKDGEKAKKPIAFKKTNCFLENQLLLDEKPTWRTDFTIYKDELRKVYHELLADTEFISSQQKYHPNVDIKLSLEKVCVNYWATEEGWKKKKSEKSKTINWRTTLTNSLSQSFNKVYYDRTNVTKNGGNKIDDNFKGELLRRMLTPEGTNKV